VPVTSFLPLLDGLFGFGAHLRQGGFLRGLAVGHLDILGGVANPTIWLPA
jgi:hypothetical protein